MEFRSTVAVFVVAASSSCPRRGTSTPSTPPRCTAPHRRTLAHHSTPPPPSLSPSLSASQEDMALARKKMEKLRFAEKQATRQKMIDRACEELNKKATSENVRLERQVEEARIKEDNELEMRAQKRQRQREAIERSRQIQLELQEQRRKADVEENQRLALHYERKVRTCMRHLHIAESTVPTCTALDQP